MRLPARSSASLAATRSGIPSRSGALTESNSVAGRRGASYVLDATNGNVLRSLEDDATLCHGPSRLMRDGRHVYTLDGQLVIWDLHTGQATARLGDAKTGYSDFAADPNDQEVVLLSAAKPNSGRQLEWWDVASRRKRHTVPQSPLSPPTFSPDCRLIAACVSDNALIMWDARTGKPLHEWKGPRIGKALAFSPDSRSILVATADGAALWDAKSFQKLRDLDACGAGADFALFSPRGHVVMIAMNAGQIWFWDVTSGRKLLNTGKDQPPMVTCGEFSPDGKQVLLGNTAGTLNVWDVASGKRLQRIEVHHWLYDVALFPGLKRAMTCSSHDAIVIWDLATGKELVQVLRLADEKGWIAITPRASSTAPRKYSTAPSSVSGVARRPGCSVPLQGNRAVRACSATVLGDPFAHSALKGP